MNTSALKTFAPAVRRQLMEAVTRKLDYVLTAQTSDYLTTLSFQSFKSGVGLSPAIPAEAIDRKLLF